LNGDDLRRDPLEVRKATLRRPQSTRPVCLLLRCASQIVLQISRSLSVST
jgi:hypothetical protein